MKRNALLIGICLLSLISFSLVSAFSILDLFGVTETPNYIIDGDSVYVNDIHVYMKTTPHTSYSNEITFELLPKSIGGITEIDSIWCFDTDYVKPSNPQLYKPHNVTRYQAYQCDCDGCIFSYNQTHFNCCKNVTVDNITNEECFESEYAYGNLSTKTAYMPVIEYKEWKRFRIDGKKNVQVGDMDRCYYTKNLTVQEGNTYIVKADIQILPREQAQYGKYWWCIKPSDESIEYARDNSHLYCLDPWFNDSWNYKQQINISSSANLTDYQVELYLNTSNVGAGFNWSSLGNDIRFVNSSEDGELDFWIAIWNTTFDEAIIFVEVNLTTGINPIYMYYDNPSALSVSNGENTFGFFDDFNDADITDWTIAGGTWNATNQTLECLSTGWGAIYTNTNVSSVPNAYYEMRLMDRGSSHQDGLLSVHKVNASLFLWGYYWDTNAGKGVGNNGFRYYVNNGSGAAVYYTDTSYDYYTEYQSWFVVRTEYFTGSHITSNIWRKNGTIYTGIRSNLSDTWNYDLTASGKVEADCVYGLPQFDNIALAKLNNPEPAVIYGDEVLQTTTTTTSTTTTTTTVATSWHQMIYTLDNVTGLMPKIGDLILNSMHPLIAMAIGSFIVGFIGLLLLRMEFR